MGNMGVRVMQPQCAGVRGKRGIPRRAIRHYRIKRLDLIGVRRDGCLAWYCLDKAGDK
jgi:hypothetical protein